MTGAPLRAWAHRLAARLGIAGRSPRARLVLGLGDLALLGAILFGLVHVIGGTVRDNPGAVTFGVTLSLGSGLALAALTGFLRGSVRD